MKENYKISEVAKLFNISRRTLIYYDEIDLFKPSYIDEENNYRYYDGHQIYVLRFILELKRSGFSLNEIKKYTSCEGIEESREFLKDKIKVIEDKIKSLYSSIEVIKKKLDDFNEMESFEGLKPKVVKGIKYKVMSIDVDFPYKYMQVQKTLKELSKFEQEYSLKNIRHLVNIDKTNLEKKNIDLVKAIGLVMSDELKIEGLKTIEYSSCITLTHKGTFRNLKYSYEKLFKYIEDYSLEITGDSFEISNKGKVNLSKEVGEVVEIYIPIK